VAPPWRRCELKKTLKRALANDAELLREVA
jgi:hypothetical protein